MSVFEQVIDEHRAHQRLLVTVLVPGGLFPHRDRVIDGRLDAQRAVVAVLGYPQVGEEGPEEREIVPFPGRFESALAQFLGGQHVQLGEGAHCRVPQRSSIPPAQVSSFVRAGSWLVQPLCRGGVYPAELAASSSRAGATHGSSSSSGYCRAEAGRPNDSTSRVTTRPAAMAPAARA